MPGPRTGDPATDGTGSIELTAEQEGLPRRAACCSRLASSPGPYRETVRRLRPRFLLS